MRRNQIIDPTRLYNCLFRQQDETMSPKSLHLVGNYDSKIMKLYVSSPTESKDFMDFIAQTMNSRPTKQINTILTKDLLRYQDFQFINTPFPFRKP
jgi:hypothetical protein